MRQKLALKSFIWIVVLMMVFSLFKPISLASVNDLGQVNNIINSLLNQGNSTNSRADAERKSKNDEEQKFVVKKVVEDEYSKVLDEWRKKGISEYKGNNIILDYRNVINKKDLNIVEESNSYGYGDKCIKFDKDLKYVEFEVIVEKDGLYTMSVDYYPLDDKITPIERAIQINGKFQYYEARRILFNRRWTDKQKLFLVDKLGNEIQPEQVQIKEWLNTKIYEATLLFDKPLKFYLKKGKNTIKFIYIRNDMLLGKIYLEGDENTVDYSQYTDLISKNNVDNKSLYKNSPYISTIEAEHPFYKSAPSIQPAPSNDPNVTPFRYGVVVLNTIGGQSWKDGNQAITYKVKVENDGYYNLAFKYIQPFKINLPVFRMILIDNKLLFEELRRYPFYYTTNWKNEVLSKDGKPFDIYLTKGDHLITLISNPAPYQSVIETVKRVVEELNNLSLEIKMATGNTQDMNRDWDLIRQIPDLVPRLKSIISELKQQYKILKKISGNKEGETRNLLICVNQLEEILKKPDEIAYKINSITSNQGSLMSMLGEMLINLPNQPLQIDKFYIFRNIKLPRAEANIFEKIKASFINFYLTFIKDYSQIGKKERDSLEIWVNRPRQYVMLMQQLADQNFTIKTGIKVSMSIMPDEGKLVLANAAKKNPDIAMSISNWLPFNLALRGAVYNLKNFSDFNKVIKRFSKGALLPFYFDGGCYAVPETQNFWVLFYRKDILDALNIPIPQTWDDVINILPKLQRYGMNFYVPLSGTGGFKPFFATLPFIYQAGGKLYSEDGITTAIDSEEALNGFKLMTKLFTIYNLPLQVPNFYNHFRQGMLPIGISDFNTYVQLTAAAPELSGWWKIAPMPGIKDKKGRIIRYAPGTGQAIVIFENSNKKKQAWEFIKWWTSEEVQRVFGNLIETIYGPEYKWNTSNVEAFKELPWPEEDLNVILEQWKWLRDVVHFPGDYMLEREISNAWNKIVFEGANYREAVENAVIETNREFRKKLEEFGYIKDGKLIRKYKIIDYYDQ